jgi:ribonuclease E
MDPMAKKMLIDATHPEETRVVVVDGNKVEEFDFESENKRQLAGNIYLAKVTRVEPSLQAAFVDYGGNRHGFLAFAEIHPDYYQIPVADRLALIEEERAYAEAQRAREEADVGRRSRRGSRAERAAEDPVVQTETSGMETIDFEAPETEIPEGEGVSPMETVQDTPVEEPSEPKAEAPAEDAPEADAEEADDNGHDDERSDQKLQEDGIESVGDDDVEDIRLPRKPRPRRYKIQEVIKVRQIMLVQVVKEERGNKGAALTTYLSLAGRYCVLMPNTERGGGISRKITNAADRKKLKEIAEEMELPRGAGLIVRTAGAQRTKTEIKRDYEYLLRLWEQIRELTLKSSAPAKIYEEGDLIKRSIRDLYAADIEEVLVEGDRGYRNAKDFMKMIMPSHAVKVKQYRDQMPLFARYQVESYLSGMFNPVVQLKSGGYIVIGVTEALVAIDVNSGRATKEGSIEETALKTNVEAAEEIARQLRLRDLAGLIVIDFIDMDERKNNASVEKRLKDKLKTDRARIQVGRISGFGLLEMSRQRLRPGMIEATTQPCAHCHGTGLVRSDDNLALTILRAVEEEGTRRRSREVLVKCPVSIANYLMNQKREHVGMIEARYGMSVRIEGDPSLISPDYTIEKFKTAIRVVPDVPVITGDAAIMDEVDEAVAAEVIEEVEVEEEEAAVAVEASEGEAKPKKKRRRRRRRSGRNSENGEASAQDADADSDGEDDEGDEATSEAPVEVAEEVASDAPAEVAETSEPKEAVAPKKSVRRSSSSRSGKKKDAKVEPAADQAAETEASEATVVAEAAASEAEAEKPAAKKPAKRTKATAAKSDEAKPRRTRKATKEAPVEASEPVAEAPVEAPVAAAEPAPEPQPAPVAELVVAEAPKPAPDVEDPAKPKKKGWWNLGR